MSIWGRELRLLLFSVALLAFFSEAPVWLDALYMLTGLIIAILAWDQRPEDIGPGRFCLGAFIWPYVLIELRLETLRKGRRKRGEDQASGGHDRHLH